MKSSNEWVSISDMMSALMMIFLFISIVYMLQVAYEKAKITEVAATYSKLQTELNNQLQIEFKDDLPKWKATIEKDNTIKFYAPEVLFTQGSKNIKPKFKSILDDFFPRYISILTNEKFKNDIEEIKIEGHTSSEWENETSFEKRYLANLNLSQGRSFEVLKYCFSIPKIKENKEWLKNVFRANGLSFAHLIYNDKNQEDYRKSRRVEFKVITKSEERIIKILELANELQ